MIAGLIPLYELPLQARGPELSFNPMQPDRPAVLLEPATTWTASARGGWLPTHAPRVAAAGRASPASPAPALRHIVFAPMSVTHLSSHGPCHTPPSAWRTRSQASSPGSESPQSPPRVETSWEVFEYLSMRSFTCDVSLPELNLGKRLAKRLLRHSQSSHGQGLKVFYIALDDIMLAACPSAAADPAKLVMHASLANSLLSHPKTAGELAIKRAIFASKPQGRPSLMHTSNADKLAVWAPDLIGGTRLVAHRGSRYHRGSSHLVLEPSEHYDHRCRSGALFEQLAVFHANVLNLAGSDAPLHAASEHMQPLVARIEALREGHTPGAARMPT